MEKKEEMKGFLKNMEEEMDVRGYFRNEERKEIMVKNMREVLKREGFEYEEMKILRGVVK